MALITLADILAAHSRIAPAAVRTPLVQLDTQKLRAYGITRALPAIYLKDESAQPIGSFKLRGAYNKIAQLSAEELGRGVITYSSGNHAQGVAYSARALGSKAVIVMPEGAPQIKRDATLALGAEVVTVGNASSERKRKAEELAAAHGYTIVPPYDDPAIIAGQATCGIEILQQLAGLNDSEGLGFRVQGVESSLNPKPYPLNPPTTPDLVLSPVSGGGLLSGVATGIKLGASEGLGFRGQGVENAEPSLLIPKPYPLNPLVYGCEPELAADAKQSFDTKTLTEWPASDTTRTICDGLRTQSLGELNFAHIMKFVDGIVAVSEPEIRLATRIILDCTGIVAEPSGAVTLAAALFHAHELPATDRIVAIVSGGNIDPALRAELEAESLTTTV
jgi:threonine dehydratase